ncbi:MAG: 16S rRNA (cytosine(967)-C(5))-methyltransferase RsmB [Lachnospiraceae bacterium]|nr:16S rRNA (cytosine(967)-C(5))-methyltransferase RsmB [Lachnospiraceae bacterium]MDE6627320.1 16S rRNA (cytosine(967)-C(5))-methyltransferase RsmB [Lachnospiraceae bacterium]
MSKQEQINTRLLALEILVEAEKKNIFVKEALQRFLFQKQFLSKQNRAFITRLVEGVTEYRVRLDYVVNLYSKTPISRCKPLIRCLLRMGVYQMLYMDSVPDGAACDECVKLAKKKGFQNLSGFVNGVLRKVSVNKECLPFPSEEEDLLSFLSVNYSMPFWIVEKMMEWYGRERTETILKACLETTDLTVRVNTDKISREELTAKLEEKGICVCQGNYVPEALHLDKIDYVKRIPGFKQGEFFVQDESSMLLYQIAGLEKMADSGEVLHILDLCAAPGGKTTQFAQQLGDRAVVEARDISEQKTELIEENRKRLGLSNIQVRVWDALEVDEEKKYWADVVIADLPCSGLGCISRKNDIKYHIEEHQLEELVNLQRRILTNGAEYVKPGGLLIYSTCTINPKENMENAKWFLKKFPFEAEDIRETIPDELRKSMVGENMLQLLQGEVKCDGFFVAKFRRISD